MREHSQPVTEGDPQFNAALQELAALVASALVRMRQAAQPDPVDLESVTRCTS